jgi:hypothetical protein
MRVIVYRLKRAYGLPVSVHFQTSSTVDLATGLKSVTRSAVRVPRAVLFPTQVHKQFHYDIGYLKANSNFTYGGLFTSDTRQVIIDKGDLPRGFKLTPTDNFYIVHNHKRYAIKTVEDLEVPAYFITMEFTGGVPTYEVHEVACTDLFRFSETIGGGLAGGDVWYQSVADDLAFTEDVSEQAPGGSVLEVSVGDRLGLSDAMSRTVYYTRGFEDPLAVTDAAGGGDDLI